MEARRTDMLPLWDDFGLPPSATMDAMDALPATPTRPLVAKQALVAAAARISTPDSFTNPTQLISVDGAPVIIHLLRMLQSAGIVRSVITLGHAAHLLEAEVRKHTFDTMAIEFVLCESSSWKRGHASNILAARSMFQEDEPFLLVMSDHIFDQRLLRRCAAVQLHPGCACVLVDESTCMVDWARPGGAHCKAHCRNGHCGSLVKVLKGEGKLVSRIGKSLTGFDALEAGAYVVTPCVFEVLRRLLVESIYCTLAEAMQVFASKGKLSYVLTDELDWFSEQTVASLHTRSFSTAVEPEWRERALAMLRVSSPHLSAENPWTTPLYDLGQTIGEGSTSVVIQGNSSTGEHMAFSGSSDDLAGMGGAAGGPSSLARRMARRQRGLAVKVVRKGATEGRLDDVERLVMWEVHVLQRLSHNHIVRVMDVIEVVDATYIVMERVDGTVSTRPLHIHARAYPKRGPKAAFHGQSPLSRSTYCTFAAGPELTEYIYEQPNRRLPPSKAILLFSHGERCPHYRLPGLLISLATFCLLPPASCLPPPASRLHSSLHSSLLPPRTRRASLLCLWPVALTSVCPLYPRRSALRPTPCALARDPPLRREARQCAAQQGMRPRRADRLGLRSAARYANRALYVRHPRVRLAGAAHRILSRFGHRSAQVVPGNGRLVARRHVLRDGNGRAPL